LTGKAAPTLEFSHPAVDAERALFWNDGRLLGVYYETDMPFIYYTDPRGQAVAERARAALPGKFVYLRDRTADQRFYVVRAMSDVDAGTFYLFDTDKGTLARIGSSYPELGGAQLGHMQSISYPAQDGTMIPGYLTVPPGTRAEHLPLIVMPHGGPRDRDRW